MSDFLFRMVERAAGVATAATPQLPRTFPWMAPAETLFPHSPATSAWETQASPAPLPLGQPAAKFNRVTVEDRRDRRKADVQASPQPSAPAASSFEPENAASETSQPLIQPSLAVQSKPHRDVKAEATKEAAPRFQTRLPENTEQTGHKVNASCLPVEAAPSKRQPLASRSVPRESRAQAADMRTPNPGLEPPVEVKIGRVEIHFDAPAAPVPSPAPARPSGFSEYAELRRYTLRKR